MRNPNSGGKSSVVVSSSSINGMGISSALVFVLVITSLSSVVLADSGLDTVELTIWHSFAAESKEEATFMAAIADYEAANPNIAIEVTMVPYANANQLFMTAAQGGQAPDIVRLSSDQLGKIGDIRVDGHPLLEDLRPHMTPTQRGEFETRALQAMRYGDALYGIPASQDSLSLIYNKALFDGEGVEYPDENWTTSDFLSAAENLTSGDVQGLAMPVKVAYWWFGFQTGFGGTLFDEYGNPSLDSDGSAESLDWLLGLEKEHGVVATGTQIESMKTQFIQSKAAMIVDGPWNWATYEAARLSIGQTLLPTVEETGQRVSPLVTYKGWAVSKQSTQKVEAVDLSLYLSSESVQKTFALDTYTIPTSVALLGDTDILNNEVITGFTAQSFLGTPAPTTRGMSLVYGPLSTAFEQVYSGITTAQEALSDANEELDSLIEAGDLPNPPALSEGYRTITIEVEVVADATEYLVHVDKALHSRIIVIGNNASGEFYHPNRGQGYDDCLSDGEPVERLKDEYSTPLIRASAQNWSCVLTGMTPNHEHQIIVYSNNGSGELVEIFNQTSSTSVKDIVPPPPDTSPILFAIGSIALSLIALLAYLRWKDSKEGKHRGKLAHLYVAPALLALAILTFYPVAYGVWLSFTDASQTHLGDQSWVGLDNFWEVITASGFVRVATFTLIWTVANVVAHVGIGLTLALVLNNAHIKGRAIYRTLLLLPWAIPSYISVLVWKGMIQPDGLINDLLGTDLNLLSDPTGAKVVVILVNIWLGVPFMMMSLSGAVQALPRDMYEAAEVDGVNEWAQFRHLTLPNLKSAVVPLSLLGFIWTFNMFNVIYLLTDGGPDLWFGEPGSTDILITYVYDVAFRDGAYGVAAAWSVVIFLMLIAFSWTYLKGTNATEAAA